MNDKAFTFSYLWRSHFLIYGDRLNEEFETQKWANWDRVFAYSILNWLYKEELFKNRADSCSILPILKYLYCGIKQCGSKAQRLLLSAFILQVYWHTKAPVPSALPGGR